MFGWFRKKAPEPQSFPDNETAFAHACRTGYRLLLDAVIPALVVEEGQRGPEGERCFFLRLAAAEGERRVWGCCLREAPGAPEIGDMVGFRIVRIASELPPDQELIGYISCTLSPVALGNRWRIARNLTPANLKPELHM